jgi:hypothetical protein
VIFGIGLVRCLGIWIGIGMDWDGVGWYWFLHGHCLGIGFGIVGLISYGVRSLV